MVCYSCNKMLSDKEIIANSVEDFIENKCLCHDCLCISNEEIRKINNE